MEFELFEKIDATKQQVIIQSGILEFSRKSYTEARTDVITKDAGISKGLLFHYFGSKKNFYLYCIDHSLKRLVEKTPEVTANDFYDVIFHTMDEKMKLCGKYPSEMHLVNMASRETSSDVIDEKNELIQAYKIKTATESALTMAKAVSLLPIKENENKKVVEALQLYTGTIISKYLAIYNQNPDDFFKNADTVKSEIRQYIDLFLYGIIAN